jgi:hypothetical protein
MLPTPSGHFSIHLWFDSGLKLDQIAKTFNQFLKFDFEQTERGYWIDEQTGPTGWSYVLLGPRPLENSDLVRFVFSAWFYDGKPGTPVNEDEVREYAKQLQLKLQRELEIPVLAHIESRGQLQTI